MKTIKTQSIFRSKLKYQFVLILSLFLCCSCSNDDTGNNDFSSYLQVKINGAERTYRASLYENANGYLGVLANNDESGIGISNIPNTIGTYEFENSDVYARFFFGRLAPFEEPELSFDAINGSVTIVEITDEKVVGIFNFQGEDYQGDILSMTEGEFDIVKD